MQSGWRWGLLLGGALSACAGPRPAPVAPAELIGSWEDDYSIRYTISDTLWFQRPGARYLILRWDADSGYLVARNGKENPADGGLFSRIDWVVLPGMAPWEWAFCLATWDAPSAEGAARAPLTDRANPRTGCGGHPFSRMRRLPADSSGLPAPNAYP